MSKYRILYSKGLYIPQVRRFFIWNCLHDRNSKNLLTGLQLIYFNTFEKAEKFILNINKYYKLINELEIQKVIKTYEI